MNDAVGRVVRNDWSPVAVPDLDGWVPTRTVSVVIPAFACQPTLDLTLASLSRQTYPADLLEVVVVDDGSEPPLVLPAIRPAHTRIVRVEGPGWGRANALHEGARQSAGEILHWLDADMIVFPEHVAAQVRWQHVLPYAVTLGYKRFVEQTPWPTPQRVAADPAGLFTGGDPHSYVERYIAQTDQLRTADHLAFRIHVGATAALRRELYEAAGGLDTGLRLGEDTELGYRLAQAGAVFVPVPAAKAWHLGRTNVMRAREQVARYNRPFLEDRIPYPRHWRRIGGTSWTVPLAEVVVPVGDEPLERVRAAVDSVLRCSERDVRVQLVGPWEKLDDGRVRVLADPALDLRLIAATYRGEPRVRLVTAAPESVFPAPYRLDLPPGHALTPDALRDLVDLADRHRAGVVTAGPATLWRTAALGRAAWVRTPGEPLLDAVTAVHGAREVDPHEVGLVDLRRYAPEDIAAGIDLSGGKRRGQRRLVATTVEVQGVRSLARAAAVVAWLGARRVASAVRR